MEPIEAEVYELYSPRSSQFLADRAAVQRLLDHAPYFYSHAVHYALRRTEQSWQKDHLATVLALLNGGRGHLKMLGVLLPSVQL